MRSFRRVLQLIAPAFFAVGAMHLALGVRADVMLGAELPPAALQDAVLDSQNRFYGVVFTIYGVLLWLSASDLARYERVLRCLLWVFFAGGIARLVSIASHGLPGAPVMTLMLLELVLPPALLVWFGRLRAAI